MTEATTEYPKFLTVQEIAKILNASEAMIYKIIRSGELPCVKLGVAIRVPDYTFKKYLEDQLAQ